MSCLASIRRGLGPEQTLHRFCVIGSKTVPGRVSVIVLPTRKGQFLPIRKGHVLPIRRCLNSEGSRFCQSGRVTFCQSRGSQFREVLFSPIRYGHMLPIRRRPNSEGFSFCQSGGFPVRRGLFCANPEGSYFGNPGVPVRRGPVSINPVGFQFGGVLILSIRKGPRNFFFNEHNRRDPKRK